MMRRQQSIIIGMLLFLLALVLVPGFTSHGKIDAETDDLLAAQRTPDAKQPSSLSHSILNESISSLQTTSPTQLQPSGRQQIIEPAKLAHSVIKGIYVSAYAFNNAKFDKLLHLVNTTDLNAMVIDLKTDLGQITYPSRIPLVQEIGANSRILIPDLTDKLQLLKSKHIYTIARIVAFKDPYLANRRKDYAVINKFGTVWKDTKGVAWLDPYRDNVWEYNIQIAQEAAQLGFDEIQFDYVRFPENGQRVDREARFHNPKGWTKAQTIEAFLKKAKSRLGSKALLSADVFGLTTSFPQDMGIGQDWSLISKHVDVISPMLYPSHYAKGTYGVADPVLAPYQIIRKAVADAKAKNEQLLDSSYRAARIRPWYQDFTATWVDPHKTYDLRDVKEQIKAAHEQGVDDFLLWNSHCSYSYR